MGDRRHGRLSRAADQRSDPWKILQPYWEPDDDKQREAKHKANKLMERIRLRNIEILAGPPEGEEKA